MTDFPGFEDELAAFATNHAASSIELARHAASLLLAATKSDPDDFRTRLGRLAVRLLRAQPSIAPLLHIVNHALLAADGPDGAAGVAARMENDLALLLEAQSYVREVTLDIGLDATIVTLGHSATVEHLLTEAASYGCRWQVVIAHSAPTNVGRALAENVASTPHTVHLVPDSASANYLRDATLLLNATAISERGLVNTVGTMGLAGVAHFLNRPVLVLAHDFTLVPDDLDALIALDPRAADGLLSPPPEGVTQDGHLYDLTPLSWLTRIYTEVGAFTPDALRMHLLDWPIHPSLLEEATRRH